MAQDWITQGVEGGAKAAQIARLRELLANVGAFTGTEHENLSEGGGTYTTYSNDTLSRILADNGMSLAGGSMPGAIGQGADGGYSVTLANQSDPEREGKKGRYNLSFGEDGALRDVQWQNTELSDGWLAENGWMIPAAVLAANSAGLLGAYGSPQAALGAGGVSAADITAAVGAPELGLAPQALGQAAGIGGVSAAEIAAAVGSPELGLVPQAAGGGLLGGITSSNVLSAIRGLAPLAAAAGGGSTPTSSSTASDPKANIDAQIAQINSLFATGEREPIYKQVYDDAYGLQSSRLNENREDTLRKLRFGLARTGLAGGSSDVNSHGIEQREFGRALADASTAAQGQADSVRANDEKTRLNLIAQMRAGMDSADATQSALAQMSDNVNAARSTVGYDALGAYTSAIRPTIQGMQVRSGQQAARDIYSTRYPQNRISLSGRNGQIVG